MGADPGDVVTVTKFFNHPLDDLGSDGGQSIIFSLGSIENIKTTYISSQGT
jgi:hypothetical protein